MARAQMFTEIRGACPPAPVRPSGVFHFIIYRYTLAVRGQRAVTREREAT